MANFNVGQFFGFRIGRPQEETKEQKNLQTFVPPESEGEIVVSGSGYTATFFDMEGVAKNENQLVTKYRKMAIEPEAVKAIDDVVNEAIIVDDNNPVVDINLDEIDILSDDMKKRIVEEFNEIIKLLNFNNKGYDIFNKWYVDGRLYYHKVIDVKKPKEGIKELRYIDPRKIKKIKEEVRRTNVQPEAKKYIEYFLYNPKGISTIHEGLRISPDSITFCHSGIMNERNNMILSHLHPALKPMNQLRWLEDAVVIYRLSRAPERRIFYIDVGNLPKMKAEQYLNDVMTKHKNKLVYDATTGELKQSRKFMTMLEDFWLPRREGSRGTEITTLPGGQNLGEMDDVEYFQKKLYKALNVPISRLESENTFNIGRSAEITRDELKFSKFINRIRRQFVCLFTDLLETQLLLKGVITKKEWKLIKNLIFYDFKKDNHFSELKDSEILRNRLEILNEVDQFVGRYWSVDWVRRTILKQSDEDIAELNAQMDVEKTEGDDEGEFNGTGDNNFGAFVGRTDAQTGELPDEEEPPGQGEPAAFKKSEPAKPKKAAATEEFNFDDFFPE